MGLEQPAHATISKKKRRKQAKRRNTPKDVVVSKEYSELNEDPFETSVPNISLKTQLNYARKGHAVLRSFLPRSTIDDLRSELLPYSKSHELEAWRQKVEVQLVDSSDSYYRQNASSIAQSLKTIVDCQDMIESLGLEATDLPFMQHFNIWRDAKVNSHAVRKLCLSSYMAEAASILLDAPTVRLYQDSLFHKRPGDGWTPYHSDCRMAPFDTSKMITFWIGLQIVPHPDEGGTGLMFVDGSHNDFALPYWNGAEGKQYDRLEDRYGNSVSHHMPLDVGDVTVHTGWTLHCAGAADMMERDRYAIAISYVDGRAEVREDVIREDNGISGVVSGDKEDLWSFRSWVEEVKPRSEFRHSQVPIVWPSDKRDITE